MSSETGGYLGVAALMLVETVFPPIPSEVVMPVVGIVAAEGRLSLSGGIAAGTAGSLAGAYSWYAAGRYIGPARLKRWAERHGRWLTISPDDIDRVTDWFVRRGRIAILIGRLVPAVRSLISLPAGIAQMPTTTFLPWSAIGTGVWSGTLATIGFVLRERSEVIATFVGIFSNVVVGGAALLYVYRLIRHRADRR
jgi:membrane protein DedA with SNARE-associated domain